MVKLKDNDEKLDTIPPLMAIRLVSYSFDAAAILHVAQKYLAEPTCPEQDRCYKIMKELCREFESITGLDLEKTYQKAEAETKEEHEDK